MKKSGCFFLLLVLFISSSQLQAQDRPQSSSQGASIMVHASASVKVAPDQAQMNMTVKATDMDINQAVQKLEQKSERLVKKLQEAGFDREELKVSHLNVQDHGRWRNGNYIDNGYVAQQHIELTFKRDQEKIARLLAVFSQQDGGEALFQFGYTLSEEAREQAYEMIIKKAVAKARRQAGSIAEASEVNLGKVRSILYGKPEYGPFPHQNEMMRMDMKAEQQQGMADMEVREIELQDSITIYWEID